MSACALGRAMALGLCWAGMGTVPATADVVDAPYFRAGPVVVVFGASDFLENGGVAPVVGDFLLLDKVADDGSGRGGLDIIAGDLRPINYNTGRFNPINAPTEAGLELSVTNAVSGGNFNSAGPHQTLDANDSFDQFVMDETTDITRQGNGNRASQFLVASNAPFDIFARADNLQSTGSFDALGLENIRFRFALNLRGGSGANRWGRKAQDPSVGGSGVVIGRTGGGVPVSTLADLGGAEPVKIFDGGRRTATAAGSILEQAVAFRARYTLHQAGADSSAGAFDFSLGTGTLAADITYTVYSP